MVEVHQTTGSAAHQDVTNRHNTVESMHQEIHRRQAGTWKGCSRKNTLKNQQQRYGKNLSIIPGVNNANQ